jgi:hypothetical protein
MTTTTMTGFTFGTLTDPQLLALVGAVSHPGGYTWARQAVTIPALGAVRSWDRALRVSDSACKALVRRGFLRAPATRSSLLYRLADRVTP